MNFVNLLSSIFLELEIIGFEPKGLTLKSGKRSYWYANCRTLTQTDDNLSKVTDIVSFYIKRHYSGDFDAIIGVPEGATMLGNDVQKNLINSHFINDNIYSLRVVEKAHGDPANKYWVNGNIPKRVILLEDVTTTAGSVLELANKLKNEMDIEIVGILSLFNRMELDKNYKSVMEKMKDAGFEYSSILDSKDILQKVIDKLPKEIKADAIEKINNDFYADYGENSPIILK